MFGFVALAQTIDGKKAVDVASVKLCLEQSAGFVLEVTRGSGRIQEIVTVNIPALATPNTPHDQLEDGHRPASGDPKEPPPVREAQVRPRLRIRFRSETFVALTQSSDHM